MNFYDIDHHFCEGNILGMPEILNSFTSIIFSLFGIYGLFNNKNDNTSFINNSTSFITNFIYSTFIVIGIGSFGFHWTEQIGWALMDEIPMIVSIFIGTLYIEYCNIFSHNREYIDINKLLDNYYCLNNYIELIYLLYEIIIKTNMLDYYNINIDDNILLQELSYHNNLNFILKLIEGEENNINNIITSFNNIKF
jgi:hypothetical protein